MLGTVNDRWPLDEIFGGWRAARSSLPPGSELVLGGHLGYFASSAVAIEDRLPGPRDGFRFVGPVPKREVAHFYGDLDVVLVPAPGGAMVTSGKVFEAGAIGVPVVVVQQHGGGARGVVEGHPLATAAEPEAGDVEAALLRAATMAMERTVERSDAARRSFDRFERSKAMRRLVDLAERVIA